MTEEAIYDLQVLWEKGLSLKEIAEAIGRPSGGAVSTLVCRLREKGYEFEPRLSGRRNREFDATDHKIARLWKEGMTLPDIVKQLATVRQKRKGKPALDALYKDFTNRIVRIKAAGLDGAGPRDQITAGISPKQAEKENLTSRQILDRLSPAYRKVLKLTNQGTSTDDICRAVGWSHRSSVSAARRKLIDLGLLLPTRDTVGRPTEASCGTTSRPTKRPTASSKRAKRKSTGSSKRSSR